VQPIAHNPGEKTIRTLILAATMLVAAMLMSGCGTGGIYAEPILFSCGYLVGDTAQDRCHVSVYRVDPAQRSPELVEEISRAERIENP
jgi:hypothetical protein